MPLTKLVRPRSTIVGPVCNVSTPPRKKDSTATISKLALPISKNWSKTFSRCCQAWGNARIVRQKSSTISPMFWNMRGNFLRTVQWHVKQPPLPVFSGGLILEKAEKERDFFGRWSWCNDRSRQRRLRRLVKVESAAGREQGHQVFGGCGVGCHWRRGWSRWRHDLVAVKIPEQRLGAAASLGIVFAAPQAPERRIISFNALVGGQDRFEQRENLQPGLTLKPPLMREQRPQIRAGFVFA